MTLRKLTFLWATAAVAATACGDDSTTPPPADSGADSVVVRDAGTDSGPAMMDSGADSGPAMMDSGADSGPAPIDSGGTDAGPAPTDSGTDAGPAPTDSGTDAGMPLPVRTAPTQGSGIAISADDTIAVAANRTAHSVSVFSLDTSVTPPAVTRTAELAFPGGEPWTVVIGNDDDTAYVVLRRDQQVVRIEHLHTAPAVGSVRATTGSEPTGLAITPSGAQLYVTNWAEGTVSVIDTGDMSSGPAIDLNAPLAASGRLGTVTARPALAHPQAVVMTNDGDADDGDESVYITEFFSQARPSADVPTDDSGFDEARQGVVYRYSAASGVSLITIAPVHDTGFVDSNGATTGCFPNQLFAAALDGARLYVTAVCESPRGPTGPVMTNVANFKTEIHTSVFVVDTATNTEVPAQGLRLTQQFQNLYDTDMVADDGASRRIPLIATDIAFVPAGSVGYVTSYGSDAVFRIQYGAGGALTRVGSAAQRFINLAPMGMEGRLPYGIAVTHAGNHALVINEFTRNVSVVTFATQAVSAVTASSDMPTGAAASQNVGRRFFVTGLGRWSLRGQGWNSCESCHPNGLTDNVTWFFGRGPRQSISLDGTYDSADPTHRRVLNWSGIFDEVHDFELNTRGNSGGVGAIVHTSSMPPANADRIVFDGTMPAMGQMATTTPQAGLNGSTISMMPGGATMPASVLHDWDDVDHYIESIRSPRAPVGLAMADVTAGRTLFADNNCAGCHGTGMWTTSRVFFTPSEANNSAMGVLRTMTYALPMGFPAGLNPPAAMGPATLRFSGMNPGANDQINCVLRAVGTFPAMLDMTQTGVFPMGAPRVREVRTDMTTAAQGATGFNPPSLLGAGIGAPYLHAGNARTLEEVFTDTFARHHQALSVNFLTGSADTRATQIRQIVAFLLSIDESSSAIAVPTTALGYDPRLCPASL